MAAAHTCGVLIPSTAKTFKPASVVRCRKDLVGLNFVSCLLDLKQKLTFQAVVVLLKARDPGNEVGLRQPLKNSGFNGNRTHDLCDAGAVLYQLVIL